MHAYRSGGGEQSLSSSSSSFSRQDEIYAKSDGKLQRLAGKIDYKKHSGRYCVSMCGEYHCSRSFEIEEEEAEEDGCKIGLSA